MSDPNAEFLQQYKQVCFKSHFQLGVKCNLTFFFFGFALVCTAIVHESCANLSTNSVQKCFFFF